MILALMYLGLHDHDRSWKSFDWDSLNRLHQKNPTHVQLEYLKVLKFSGDNLLVLINDILEFSKIE